MLVSGEQNWALGVGLRLPIILAVTLALEHLCLATIAVGALFRVLVMETNYNYTCPNCSQECALAESLTGQNVICPHCLQEFFATPPDSSTQVIIPEKLPFFKSGRRKILEERMAELIADGELSNSDEDVLNRTAILLGLKETEVDELEQQGFLKEFSPIQRRMEQSFQLTDQDQEDITALQRNTESRISKWAARRISSGEFTCWMPKAKCPARSQPT